MWSTFGFLENDVQCKRTNVLIGNYLTNLCYALIRQQKILSQGFRFKFFSVSGNRENRAMSPYVAMLIKLEHQITDFSKSNNNSWKRLQSSVWNVSSYMRSVALLS